ncbi:MAG: hypothetical protein KKG33_13350 [candidate division Zixibacteria bacterium]|nr:hypothetical protein [candidate division Zixibacteria bacterium]MBU1471508.1 hypothetical protein [candidate division Zixibacteria bacterium]MBU2626539.1 hypothetical protein [candidate division Zixibacteria bacterium]
MFNKILHLVLIGVYMLPTVFIGCTEKDVTTNASAELTEGEPLSGSAMHEGVIWPFSSEDPSTGIVYTGTLYMYGSQVGQAHIMSALNLDQIVITEIYLANQGFSIAHKRCKYIATSAEVTEEMIGDNPWEVGDTISVEITMLAFEQPTADSSEESLALIKYTNYNGQRWHAQLEKVFYGNYPSLYWGDDEGLEYQVGLEQLPDGSYGRMMWTESFRPSTWAFYDQKPSLAPLTDPPDPRDPDVWDWNQYLKCLAIGYNATCYSAAVACIFSALAWPACFGIGCGAGMLGTTIGCALEQLL